VVKWSACEGGHSPPPIAEIKNGRARPPLPHTSFYHHLCSSICLPIS
jgi:hypothetical protein